MKRFHPQNPEVDGRLALELRALALRLRARRLHALSARVWALTAVGALALLGLGWLVPATALLVLPILLVGAFIVSLVLAFRWQRAPLDYHEAGAAIEQDHPKLQQVLRTALEQQPDDEGRLTYLQRRVINRAVEEARRHDWRRARRAAGRGPLVGHVAAVTAVAAILLAASHLTGPTGTWTAAAEAQAEGVEVTPGDAEIERGSTVIIAARFEGPLPRDAALAWTAADGRRQVAPMTRSLSDPVYAHTLAAVPHDVAYRIEYAGTSTTEFRLAVYDRPALVRADASLDYPEYTGLTDRRIEDTRRVSAVEGTQVDYEFLASKPLRQAVLREADGSTIELTPADEGRTRFSTRIALTRSLRFSLHLVDEAGRGNTTPPDIRLEALPNRRPELKLAFPRGDQRVSPLEEIRLQGEARDDFRLLDYGVGYTVGAEAPEFVSLQRADEEVGTPPRVAAFQHVLALEPRGAAPDDLVSWFAWADDHGPDGKSRRTTSDLFFAEVRPFDEIFREADGAGRQQQQQGGQAGGGGEQLLELQRQVSLAIWKLRQQEPPGPEFEADIAAIAEGQERAQGLLTQAAAELENARHRAAAGQAARFMEQTVDGLGTASDQRSLDPLADAWSASQGAYQALLRLQPREQQIARQRDAGGGQGRSSASQRQLNQLRFRNAEDRYETASQAQALTSPEERAQLEVLSRLRELARRQQDVNQRLQELQTALAAARDEAERERIERELKRLEEEQRRMVADLDDVRQRLDRQSTSEQAREARQQLDETREQMRRTGEAIGEGRVSQALATGTRTREDLEQVRDDLRRESSSRFGEQMREARRAARQLAERQEQVERDLTRFDETPQRRLDDSDRRGELAESLDQQRQNLDTLVDNLRTVTEDSEETEPRLHRQLYDLLREQGQADSGERLRAGSELLRRGFVEQAGDLQRGVTRDLQRLQRGIEQAAESVLGDEASTLRFAQRELDELSNALGGESADSGPPEGGSGASGSEPRTESMVAGGGSGGGADPEGDATDELTRALEELAAQSRARGGAGGGGPLTGEGFGEWAERLRTVESLLEQPEAQARIASAREEASRLRQDYRRHGTPPQWEVVEGGIVAPLSEVRAWLRQEIARRDNPESLQPVDRDPVPERFAEAVRRYYEALGQ